MIYGAVKGQLLKVKATAVADAIDYLTANFTFLTSEWNGLVIYAHFAKGDERHSVELTDGKISEEDHLNLSAGEWSVYLHGNEYSHGDVKKRVTTDIAKFTVEPTGVLDGEPFPEVEASIVEEMLAELADHEERIADLEEGGGGGGTKDYTQLTNKPSINNVELDGNKTSGDLGLVSAETGKGLSSNDFTDAEKEKLAGVEVGAEANVQTDWNQDDSTADDYLKNKPNFSAVATSGDYNDLSNKPNLSAVAISGSYNDLSDKPTGYEETTNKVTSLSSSSTDTQYPSAKCVYDYIDNVIGNADALLGTGVIS